MPRVTSFQTFQLYVALKNYFFKEYDIFKYGYKTNVKESSFRKRKDCWIFEKLSKNYKSDELVELFVSNYIWMYNPGWVGDFIHSECDQVYMDWKRKIQALTYTFTQDLEYMRDYCDQHALTFADLFREDKKVLYPLLYKLLFLRKVQLETVTILDKLLEFSEKDNKKYADNPSIVLITDKIRKYHPFLIVNRSKFSKILLEKSSINKDVGVASPTPV